MKRTPALSQTTRGTAVLWVCCLSLAACGRDAPIEPPVAAATAPEAAAIQLARSTSPESGAGILGSGPPRTEAAIGGKRLAERFGRWEPLHAFATDAFTGGRALGGGEALVWTRRGLVGVTPDGGQTWRFAQPTLDRIRSGHGEAGGPYVVVGDLGLMATSSDGETWQQAPRLTGDRLVDVTVRDGLAVALGAHGDTVWWSTTGQTGARGALPARHDARRLSREGDAILAVGSRSAYALRDDGTWELDEGPRPAAEGVPWTSRGVCALSSGRVRCGIRGLAYGLSETTAFIAGSHHVAYSTDGGRSWRLSRPPTSRVRWVLGAPDGPYLAAGRRGDFAVSSNGVDWRTLDARDVPVGLGWPPPSTHCASAFPDAGQRCAVDITSWTPRDAEGLRGMDFNGDEGVVWGAGAQAWFTADGGATWQGGRGIGLSRIRALGVRGSQVVATDGYRLAASTTSGMRFHRADLPAHSGRLELLHLGRGGVVFAAGRGGVLLRSEGDLRTWIAPNLGGRVQPIHFVAIHEVGDAVYCAGSRGELHRSQDSGATWREVPTGIHAPVLSMVALGDQVLALSAPGAPGAVPVLLASRDQGMHFAQVGTMGHATAASRLTVSQGQLVLAGHGSRDGGRTWIPRPHHTRVRGVAVDAEGRYRLQSRPRTEGGDALWILGPGPDDEALVAHAPSGDSLVACNGSDTCFMGSGSGLYRVSFPD
jgi:photosystem II stability/assembly factor-like uncharacterized protein/predicted small lipoprotein YifL